MEVFRNRGDVALGDKARGHGGAGGGWTWWSYLSFPILMIL